MSHSNKSFQNENSIEIELSESDKVEENKFSDKPFYNNKRIDYVLAVEKCEIGHTPHVDSTREIFLNNLRRDYEWFLILF